MESSPIIARFVAEATDNTERCEVCVRELVFIPYIGSATKDRFEVFVNGGLMANGEESVKLDSLGAALVRASAEVKTILGGGN